MGKITDFIFNRKHSILTKNSVFGDLSVSRHDFKKAIFLNCCEILTDLTNDVTFVNKSASQNMLFSEFKEFFNRDGQLVLNLLLRYGYVVVGSVDNFGFRILQDDEYTVLVENKRTYITPKNQNLSVYVIKSQSYETEQCSDYTILKPFLDYLDNVLNASGTINERLGAVIMASPQQTSMNTTNILTTDDKEEIEKTISEGYGALAKQKQFLLFTKPMQFNAISLASMDNKTVEKVKIAVLAIADRLKIPANQIAIIDAMGSKSFANGSEMIAGDFSKYQSFERLLNRTFVRFADDLGLQVDYQIYNKPTLPTNEPTNTATI